MGTGTDAATDDSGPGIRTGDSDGLPSSERSCRSSTAPLAPFTTTTGISVSALLGESPGLGLGLGRQTLLLPVGTLAAPPSEYRAISSSRTSSLRTSALVLLLLPKD